MSGRLQWRSERRVNDGRRALEFLENLGRRGHQRRRAIPDQSMTSRRHHALNGARHGHDAAAEILCGKARRDVRA